MYKHRYINLLFFSVFLSSSCELSAQTVLVAAPDSTAILSTSRGSHLTVSGSRPIKNIVMSLTEEHGNVVDYEELPLKDDALYQDTANETYRSLHGGRGWLSLRTSSLDLQTAIPLGESNITQTEGALSELLTKYNTPQAPYKFRLVNETADRLSVVASSSRNNLGVLAPQPAILDSVIQLNSHRQTILDAVSSLTKQLSALSGDNVVIGTMPVNIVMNNYCVPSSDTGSARSLLAKIFDASPIRLAWILMYDRQSNKYVLNAVVSSHYLSNSRGGRALVPVLR